MITRSLQLLILSMIFLLSSCELAGDIFKGGVYVGIFLVVLVIVIILWIVRKIFR